MHLRSLIGRAAWCAAAVVPLFTGVPLAAGQAPEPPRLSEPVRREVVETIARQLVQVYVDADTGRRIAHYVRERQRRGAYRELADAGEFASALTEDLRSINGDRHLSVQYSPGFPTDSLGPDGVRFADADSLPPEMEAMARGAHYGIGRLEILPGNLGYAELRGFWDGPRAEAAMLDVLEYLADAEAVILDLRRHGGGSGDMSNWLLSHFLGGDSLLTLRIVNRSANDTTDRYTLARVPGPRRPDVPLFILTSGLTGSAAEDFTFVLDNLGRAVVVGERTAGAGHNNAMLDSGHGFVTSISFTRVSDPASGREWERVGIAPDIPAEYDEALTVARLAALDTITARRADPRVARLNGLLKETTAAMADRRPLAEGAAAYVGTYGTRQILFSGDRLRYRFRPGFPAEALIPLSDSVYTLEAMPAARLAFIRAGGDVRLSLTFPDGRTAEFAREE